MGSLWLNCPFWKMKLAGFPFLSEVGAKCCGRRRTITNVDVSVWGGMCMSLLWLHRARPEAIYV